MIAFLNTHLTRKQKIRLYRLCLILDDIDFGYLRPVFLGTLLGCLLYWGGQLAPYYRQVDSTLATMYLVLIGFVALSFLYFLMPYVRKLRAKYRVYMNRRKKRATFTLFV